MLAIFQCVSDLIASWIYSSIALSSKLWILSSSVCFYELCVFCEQCTKFANKTNIKASELWAEFEIFESWSYFAFAVFKHHLIQSPGCGKFGFQLWHKTRWASNSFPTSSSSSHRLMMIILPPSRTLIVLKEQLPFLFTNPPSAPTWKIWPKIPPNLTTNHHHQRHQRGKYDQCFLALHTVLYFLTYSNVETVTLISLISFFFWMTITGNVEKKRICKFSLFFWMTVLGNVEKSESASQPFWINAWLPPHWTLLQSQTEGTKLRE